MARAPAAAPRFLQFDNARSALHLNLRRGLQADLKRIQHELGITVLLAVSTRAAALSLLATRRTA